LPGSPENCAYFHLRFRIRSLTATTGCKGLPTSPRQTARFDKSLLSRRATIVDVCARFGSPQQIKRARDGTVTWDYDRSGQVTELAFKHGRLVEGAWFDRRGAGH
jgi:hypothetical protein